MKPICKYPEYPGNWPNPPTGPVPFDPDTSGDDPLSIWPEGD